MKNKYEDWCYVCGLLVEEEKGLAEKVARHPGDPGWGETRWVVRHPNCVPPQKPDIDQIAKEYETNYNNQHNGN
jgi:hypothetical protein